MATTLADAAIDTGRHAFGVRSARRATNTMGLGGMFVLQAPSAHLYALHGRLAQGLGSRSPARFGDIARDQDPAETLR